MIAGRELKNTNKWIEKEDFVVFNENNTWIMFDKNRGAFCQLDENNLYDVDKIHEKYFLELPEAREVIACEGPRLGRLSFLTTQVCNLQCKYCFANSGTYNAKGKVIMNVEIMKKAFEEMCKRYSQGVALVHFFGGEPMIGFDNIKKFVPWCYQFCEEQKLLPPIFSIVSNGTILNEEIFNFLNEYKVNIVISVDGNRELNNLTRVSSQFDSVYDYIKENLSKLPQERDFKLGCEMTVNHNHIERYRPGIVCEWLDDICAMGFDYMTVGVAETESQDCKIQEWEAEVLQDIERETVDYFFKRLMNEDRFLSVEIVGIIRQIAQHRKALPCGAGYHSLTVNAEGTLLPCYQFYHDDKFVMGNICKDEYDSFEEIRDIFKDTEACKPSECTKCWLQNYCTVLCRGFSYSKHTELNHIAKSRCNFFNAAMRRIIWNISELQKNPEEYKRFVERLYNFNKFYTYNR